MNTLLIPTDFSPVADNALQYAIDMAKEYNFDITLYHVVQLSTIATAEAVYIDTFSELSKQAEIKLNEKANSISQQNPSINVHFKVDSGLFLDSLNAYCQEIAPIAVVMGMSGTGSTMDKIIGSHAINAMNTLHQPMIIVPHKATFKPIHKICFACDLKQVATATPIVAFKAFSKLFNAQIHILNIDFHNRHFTPETKDEIDSLYQLFENIQHEFHFIESENVQNAIDDFIDKNGMDMVIMIPKKHSFWEGLFRKSQTKEMMYHSHIPILALHQN